MWWQRLGTNILYKNSICYAICLLGSLAATVGLPLVNWIPCLVVALVTLAQGARAGAAALLWALTPVLALALAVDYINIHEMLFVQFLLVWLYALCWRSNKFTLVGLVWCNIFLGIVLVTLFHLIVGDVISFWQNFLFAPDGVFSKLMPAVSSPGMSAKQLLQPVLPYLAGMATASILCSALLAVIAAAIWFSGLQRDIKLQNEISRLRFAKVSLCLPLVLLLFSVAVYLFNKHLSSLGLDWSVYFAWLQDTAPIYLAFYGLVGLSLLHALCPRHTVYRWLLYGAYILLFVVPHYMLFVLLLVVLVDSGFNLRARSQKLYKRV